MLFEHRSYVAFICACPQHVQLRNLLTNIIKQMHLIRRDLETHQIHRLH